jgi:uroporphyrinogen-III decarboxylase
MKSIHDFLNHEKTLEEVYKRRENRKATATLSMLGKTIYRYKETVQSHEKMMEQVLHLLSLQIKAGCDMIPLASAYCTVGMVAEAFGAKIIMPEDGFPWVEHATDSIRTAADIVPKKITELEYYQRLCSWIAYYYKNSRYDFPLSTIDIQSPFSVAAQIVNTEEFMMACYDDPVSVHKLLDHITEYSIHLEDHQIKLLKNSAFPGHNFPSIRKNIGICLADDTPAIMLSEAQYREFALPYNSAIGRHFGGVHIHSCGNYIKNIPAILDIENVCSLQMHAGAGEMNLPDAVNENDILKKTSDSVVLFVDNNPISRGDVYSKNINSFYSEYLLPRLSNLNPKWLIMESCISTDEDEKYNEQIEMSRKMLLQI